jgi:ABC-2 type transport system permease protein
VAVQTQSVFTVREPAGTLVEDLRAIRVVWKREMIRFLRDRLRIVTALAQPVFYLFILGTGLSSLVTRGAALGFDYRTFMFPGVICMTVLFTALFSSMSIVWDREFGFLREMLVAPVSRAAIVIGKALGGATVATCQGAIMLALAGFVHVPYAPTMLLALLFVIALTAFALTATGLFIASRIQQMQAFQVVMQFFVLPMYFLSGAIFPLNALPIWLAALTKINPLSYAVDPMRRIVFAYVAVPPAVEASLSPGITWGTWHLPIWFELMIVLVCGLIMLGGAVFQFSRPE